MLSGVGPTASGSASTADVLDLLGGGAGSAGQSQVQTHRAETAYMLGARGHLCLHCSSLVDVWAATPECWLLALQAPAVSHSGAFDDLLGGPTPSAASPSFPNIVAWQKDGITVTFSFSKPAGHPEVTQIEGSYSNTSDTAISDFSLQVRLWLSSSTSAAAQQADAHTLG